MDKNLVAQVLKTAGKDLNYKQRIEYTNNPTISDYDEKKVSNIQHIYIIKEWICFKNKVSNLFQ